MFHYHKTLRYDRVKCSVCNVELRKPKKQIKLETGLDRELARIRYEIKEYGHPLLKGITST